MKYKVGDTVRIKSLDWYNENKDEYGYIDCGSRYFFTEMSDWCGKIATIEEIDKTNCYRLEEYDYEWTDEMIEGLVEEETKPLTYEETVEIIETMQGIGYSWECPQGYQFVDENGNVINATKIVLEKKKPKYPKTYEACENILGLEDSIIEGCLGYEYKLLNAFQKLLMCKDAYWKIAGEEMGLGKSWEPDENEMVYAIFRTCNGIEKRWLSGNCSILEFPTEEMRDAFYENFKELIESVKELL